MVERCDELGLALEPGDAFRVGGNVGRQHLHRDIALEHRVSRAIDDTHAALAQATGDFHTSRRGYRKSAHRTRRVDYNESMESVTRHSLCFSGSHRIGTSDSMALNSGSSVMTRAAYRLASPALKASA